MIDLYDAGFVEKLFDEMAGSYELVNYISSFGFSKRWRRQFVEKAGLRPGMVVCDLMCGMGECWEAIAAAVGRSGQLVGIDLSAAMLKGAEHRRSRFHPLGVKLFRENVLHTQLEDGSVDSVICGFGVKMISDEQQEVLAAEVRRILKPRGTFSFIEVSVPHGWIFKGPYLFYLGRMIPLIGQMLLGNPENYRMLGVYTEKFGDCRVFHEILAREGLQATYQSYFFGCATGVCGFKH